MTETHAHEQSPAEIVAGLVDRDRVDDVVAAVVSLRERHGDRGRVVAAVRDAYQAAVPA